MENQRPSLSFVEKGTGPVLVLLHGLFMSHTMFDTVLPSFAERHRVILPDLRGYGGSVGLGPPYSIPQLAKDVVELLDHLEVKPVDLFGYSEGGIVAECIAAVYPDRVRRLVLACTYAYNQGSALEKIEAAVVPWVFRGFGKQKSCRWVLSHFPEIETQRGNKFCETMASMDKESMLAALHEANFFDARPLLPRILVPTLVLAGGKDDAVPMHNAKELASGIEGARLDVLPEGRHTLIWTNPDFVLDATERFLQATES